MVFFDEIYSCMECGFLIDGWILRGCGWIFGRRLVRIVLKRVGVVGFFKLRFELWEGWNGRCYGSRLFFVKKVWINMFGVERGGGVRYRVGMVVIWRRYCWLKSFLGSLKEEICGIEWFSLCRMSWVNDSNFRVIVDIWFV